MSKYPELSWTLLHLPFVKYILTTVVAVYSLACGLTVFNVNLWSSTLNLLETSSDGGGAARGKGLENLTLLQM